MDILKLIRANFADGTLSEFTTPIIPQFNPQEELVISIDQSTTSMGITIMNRYGVAKELIKIRRQSKETSDQFLMGIKSYVAGLVKHANVIAYSLEEVVGYGKDKFKSQKVTASTHTKMREVYSSIQCVSSNGEPVNMRSQAELISINNAEWKRVIIPARYKKMYKDIKAASVEYASSKYPIIGAMGDDVADSFCMAEFLVKTQFGYDNLYPIKSRINKNNDVVILAMPWKGINADNTDYMAFANPDGSLSDLQLAFYRFYKAEAIKYFIKLLQDSEYSNQYIEHDKDILLEMVGRSVVQKKQMYIDEYLNHAKFFNLKDDTDVIQFTFNDTLSLEDNFRCFTGDRSKVFYTIIDDLNLCQIIPQFQLTLKTNESAIVFGMAVG